MSHLPPDTHRRLERTCADGAACRGFVPCPPGRCVKAGRDTGNAIVDAFGDMVAREAGRACVECGGALQWRCPACRISQSKAVADLPATPPGWQLVPMEPTPAMCASAVTTICYGPEGGFTRTTGPRRCWDTMLAAAPVPPAVLLPAEREALTAAARDVLAERQRQIKVEGWTPEHDDQHGDQSMSIAAACYALADMRAALRVQTVHVDGLWSWTGWAASWFKPKDRRSNLVRAAALLLAEIERLDRAAG